MDITKNQEITKKVKELIAELCPAEIKDMDDSSHLTDELGYHSLALVELAFSLEDMFDLEPIDQAVAKNINTVGDIINYVTEKVEKNQLEEA